MTNRERPSGRTLPSKTVPKKEALKVEKEPLAPPHISPITPTTAAAEGGPATEENKLLVLVMGQMCLGTLKQLDANSVKQDTSERLLSANSGPMGAVSERLLFGN